MTFDIGTEIKKNNLVKAKVFDLADRRKKKHTKYSAVEKIPARLRTLALIYRIVTDNLYDDLETGKQVRELVQKVRNDG